MKALVFVEHRGDALEPGSLAVLGKAASLGGDVAAVLSGVGPLDAVASEVGRFGAAKVFVAAGAVAQPLPQPTIDVLEHVVVTGGYDMVLFSTSVLAADVAAGLAARLDAGLNWDLVDVVVRDGEPVGRRLALQDTVLVEVGWRSECRLALFRKGSFEPGEPGPGTATIETVAVEGRPYSKGAAIVASTPRGDGSPSLADAEVIVAGGIGLGGAEHFALAEELADLLGGAVGATRAAVYKGWYRPSSQIGQTGATVSPRLYIALGISGAVQHKVGMESSKVIVAVNTDPSAPIFEFSDLAVVGDVHAVVPKLVELLRARTGP